MSTETEVMIKVVTKIGLANTEFVLCNNGWGRGVECNR